MGLYLYRWNGDPAAREQMNRVADLAQRAGIKWSREEFQWHRIEPRKGEFDWNFYDQMVEVAHKHGISVYGLLAYWSEWTKPNTVEGIRDYCNWARQVVRRYKGKVNSWEVWNEPNIFFWTGPKEMYADLLARTYETIKSEDPNAIVLGCATSGIDTNFIKMTMERGGKFDALAIHPYRGDLRDLEFMRELRDVRQLVNKRPVWITELGFPTELIEGYSERNQASLVARLYLTALASEAVQNIAWYDFRNDGVDPYEKEQNFGLVRNDLRPKPGYRTLAALGQAIDGCRPGMAVEVGDGAYAFRFVAKDRDVIAVCAPDNGRLLTFMATPPDIHLVNGAGEPVEPFMSDGHATVTLDTGFPIYITGKPGFKLRTAEPVMRLIADRKQARPGNTVTLQLTPFSERVDWELPVNWLIRRTERDGEYSLTIPITAIPGHTQLRAIVRDGGILRLPLTLSIQPQVIKL